MSASPMRRSYSSLLLLLVRMTQKIFIKMWMNKVASPVHSVSSSLSLRKVLFN